MKTAISLNTINRDTSGPGAFMRAAKWYWDEVTEMIAAAGFTSLMIPMVPNTENVARNGAPICTASIKTRYGSGSGYLKYLNEKGIADVAAMSVSAQSLLDSLFETGLPMEDFFDEFYRHAEDVCTMLKELNGTVLMISPTPAIGPLLQVLCNDKKKLDEFYSDTMTCLNRIGAMCKEKGVNACIKNDFWTFAHGAHIEDFLSLVDTSLVGFVPDTAQLAIADADYVKLTEKYADIIPCMSFTDTRYQDVTENYKSISPEYPQDGPIQRCYCDLGYGNINFKATYQSMKKTDFDGVVVLESRYTLDVPKAILRMRTFWTNLTKENSQEVTE